MRRLVVVGLTYERYQQVFGDARAQVLGGELTLYRNSSGANVAVLGTHYPAIVPTNSVSLTAAEARQVTERDLGPNGTRTVDLLINPASGRFFFRVETRRFDERWIHWIDASNGRVLRKFDNLQQDHGTGVKGDTKDLNGPNNAATGDDLTTFHNAAGHGAAGAHWDLFSNDNRQQTYNAKNGQSFAYFTTDTDNHWTTVTANRKSPGQPAMVDAQYYANLADDYYQAVYGLDWIGDCGYAAMQSVVHYKVNYSNAFWNGTYVVYGDGDGSTDREYSGGLDIVAHEYAHAITDCTSLLIYQDESGALNESFSDIVGNSAEFYANEPNSTSCVLATGQLTCADWWIGEDIDLASDTVPGFRNMASPAEDGDPDHYTERQIGGVDNGGVHTNSGIPNHAFYLLAEGGSNASGNPGPIVTGIGLADAQQIFFLGLIGLPSTATMCDARAGTEAIASSLFGAGSQEKASTADAWRAVGLTDAQCGVTPNTPPTADSTSATTTQGSPVPVDLSGSDPETCELTFTIVAPPANGSVGSITDSACTAGSPNTDAAAVTYTPNGGFTGSDSFTYKVNDGTADSNVATASVTVNAAADYATTVLADSPAAYWRLGEASGTSAADSSGNGNTANYENGPTLGAPGLISGGNTSVAFDGIDDRALASDSTSLSPTSALTVEAWVNADTLPTTDGAQRFIVFKSQAYLLRLERISGQTRFVFFIYGGDSYEPRVTSGAFAIVPGQTSHVVGTYDGSTLKMYVDGIERGSVSRAVSVNDSIEPLLIGRSVIANAWDGRIDEVAVYDHALTLGQVQAHFTRGTLP